MVDFRSGQVDEQGLSDTRGQAGYWLTIQLLLLNTKRPDVQSIRLLLLHAPPLAHEQYSFQRKFKKCGGC